MSYRNGELDKGILVGIGLSCFLIISGIYFGGLDKWYVSVLSLFLVLGGTFIAVSVNFSKSDLRSTWFAFQDVLRIKEYDARDRVEYFLNLSRVVRQDGLLALEEESRNQYDLFLRTALLLAVDGNTEKEIRRSLTTEIQIAYERSSRAEQVFETMGNFAPAMGLIGTIVGLIQMLGSLSNPESIGPAMALALITTLYGATLSNVIFIPLSGKLKLRADAERFIKSLSTEAIISLSKQENPIVLERKLQAFMPIQEAA
jgi:chemotaxis protein MotA